MKNHIFLLIFFVALPNIQCSADKRALMQGSSTRCTNLLNLPMELINLIIPQPQIKPLRMISAVSKAHYVFIYNYLLYKQDILLLMPHKSRANQFSIIKNNALLLGYIRNTIPKICGKNVTLQTWSHGKLLYFLTDEYDEVFYVSKNTKEKLYRAVISKKI